MSRDCVEIIRNYHQKGLEWVKQLGVDKVIDRANRILRRWGVSRSVVLMRLPEITRKFDPQGFPHFAFVVEDLNIPLAYISLESSEVVFDWGFLYTYNLPTVSEGSVLPHPIQNDPLPFPISLPKALAIATLQFSLPKPPWWGKIVPHFENPSHVLVVFLSVSYGNLCVSKISVVFKERTAHCSVLKFQVGREDTEICHEFEGTHEEVVREILRIATLMAI